MIISKLKYERLRAEVNQTQAARVLGVTQSTLSLYESHKIRLPSDLKKTYLKKLAGLAKQAQRRKSKLAKLDKERRALLARPQPVP